jgi:spoIIIJ-associated protein
MKESVVSEQQQEEVRGPIPGSAEELEQAKIFLSDLLQKMLIPCSIKGENAETAYVLDIVSESEDDMRKLTGRRGQLMDALQHLVAKRLARGRDERGKAVIVDAGGFRKKHIERLEDLAERMAEKCRETKAPVRLNPMSPFDRRIVHMRLAEIKDVKTESDGEGEDRHVVVYPVAEG